VRPYKFIVFEQKEQHVLIEMLTVELKFHYISLNTGIIEKLLK
jgi:hypothetical protein